MSKFRKIINFLLFFCVILCSMLVINGNSENTVPTDGICEHRHSLDVVQEDTYQNGCLVCNLADMINKLPLGSEITKENCETVAQQIREIDKIKFDLTDEGYEELLILLDDNYSTDISRYFDAIAALQDLMGNVNLVITKKFVLEDGAVLDSNDERLKDVSISVEVTPMTGFISTSNQMMLLDNTQTFALSYDSSESSLVGTYSLPAYGRYKIREVNTNQPIVIDGKTYYTKSVSYTYNGNTVMSDDGVEVSSVGDDSGNIYVELQNNFGPGLDSEENNFTIKIQAVDADETPLEGAYIQVLDSENNVVKEWDSTTDAYEVEGLKYGTYTLTVTEAPEGYILPADITFSIDEYGTVSDFSGSTTTDENGNKVLLVELKQVKIGVINGYDGNGNPVFINNEEIELENSGSGESITTTKSGDYYIPTGLKAGNEYTLKVKSVPDGYILPDDITFSIDGSGNISGENVTTGDDRSILVKFEKTKVQIQAVDAAETALAGAHIQILDSESEPVDEWNSTTEAHTVEGLKIGETYTLKVTTAPEGYILPADITFSIDGSGNISGENVTTGDDGSILVKFEKTKVQIQAVDAEETALAGAHIQILDSESQVVEEWDTTAEAHTVEGLKTEETYILTVTTAPDGYILPADYNFTINDDGTVSYDNIGYDENGNEVLLVELKKIEIKTVELVSGENQLLSGVGLKILDNEGIVVGENSWSSANSNPYIPKGLKTNVTYTLEIDSVPNNWYITPEATNFTIDKDGNIEISNLGNIYVENNTITVQLEKNELQIHVVDETNNKPLVDTKVQILDPDGKVISEWTSNELSFVATNLQFDKVYTIHIVKPSNGYKKPEHDSTFKINNDKSIEIISGANLSTSLNTTGHIRLLDIKLEKDEVSVPNNSNNNSGNKWNIENFESKEINGIKHYFDGGRTYVKIPETPGIVWLKEESDGTSAWYGLDNSSSTFEPNSIFYVEWHSPGSSKYEDLYSQLDKNIKSQIEDDNGWIFQTGVLTQTGDKITEIKNLPVNLYVQIGDDWDLKDLKSVYIQSQSDENTAVTYVENLKYPEGTDNFGIMKLKHFSPYFIYDTEDDIITDNNTTESTNKNNSINNSIATGDETTKTIILVSVLIIITSGVIIFWALKRKK